MIRLPFCMRRITAAALVMAAPLALAAAPGLTQSTKLVGGASMYPTKSIVENAVNSKNHPRSLPP